MVVSSGFLDHAAEVYLRASDSIMSAQPITSSTRVGEWSQQLQQQQQTPSNQLTAQSTTIKVNPIPQQPARAILICQPNSHPFQTRNINLDSRVKVKVGRSVPRSRVEDSNAIFDCKVLSRNHAVIWYNDGKFFIKDTGSSNGTFINSQRIKPSEPAEISSGDTVQFGVDVTENSRKETHGCIIALLKLLTPDGLEKTSYHLHPSNQSACNFDSDIYRLNQIMHESFQREQILEAKLISLQKAVETTRKNSSNSWQAMIHEDLLLSRIDILENKLLCYQKNITDEKLQKEIVKLHDDKTNYQCTAKEALKKVYQDRMAILQKFTQSEQSWQSSEDELSVLRSQQEASKDHNEELTNKLIALETEYNALSDQCVQMAKQAVDSELIRDCLETAQKENEELKGRLQLIENINAEDYESSDSNKNLTSSWNKPAIMDWLNNSDLKNLKESEDIINAMCNDAKSGGDSKVDLQKCMQLYERILEIEKRYFTLDNKVNDDALSTHSDESVTTVTSDGNQNNRQCINEESDLATMRSFVTQLKEVYAEFQNQLRLLQKDLIRASKYEELQTKLAKTMLDLHTLQNEVRSQTMLTEYEEKMKLQREQRDEICVEKPKSSDVENIPSEASSTSEASKQSEPSGVEDVKEKLSSIECDATETLSDSVSKRLSTNSSKVEIIEPDADLSVGSNIPFDNSFESQIAVETGSSSLSATEEEHSNDHDDIDDDFDEKDVLESFDRIIEEECKLINDTDILREEELVEFKERCIKLTDENIVLRKEIDSLRHSASNHLTTIIYAAPIAILLLYYLLSLNFS